MNSIPHCTGNRTRRPFWTSLWLLPLLLLSGCSTVLFYPERELRLTPDLIGLDYRSVQFEGQDGTDLHGWLLPANGPAKGTVVFFHGNAQNISTHIASVFWLPDEGYNVFLFDYRGFGRSGGRARLGGINRDGVAALQAVRRLPEVDPTRLLILGQSIGGNMATYAVTHGNRNGIRAVVLDSTFASYRQITREKLASLILTWPLQYPLSWLMPDRYSAGRLIDQIAPTPLLILHGTADTAVPLHHGQRLFKLAHDPKQLRVVSGARHIEALANPAFDERAPLLDFFANALAEAP